MPATCQAIDDRLFDESISIPAREHLSAVDECRHAARFLADRTGHLPVHGDIFGAAIESIRPSPGNIEAVSGYSAQIDAIMEDQRARQ